MRLLKGGWAAKRFQGPALPWAGLLLVLLAASAIGVELLVKGLPANHSLYGDAKARWTINEYADLECPFCKVYTPRLKRWVDSHPDVNLVWRHLPLQMHGEAARHQARLVECAGIQGGAKAFWSAIDAIFTQSVGNGGGRKRLANTPPRFFQLAAWCPPVFGGHHFKPLAEDLPCQANAAPIPNLSRPRSSRSVPSPAPRLPAWP
ncbi:TPA: DsbA family protein [Pseudomonas aeruginosa]